MIKNINYIDEEVHKIEQDKIFHNSWFFVGIDDKLLNKNDYITYKCGSVSIFIQNFGDELKCFSNICLHRFNSIHKEKEGNGHLICNYHNWIYNEHGESNNTSLFSNCKSDNCSSPKLELYEVEKCGKFIFVKINNHNKSTLREYLGSFFLELIELSNFFGEIINEETLVIANKANWKLLVENVLECYHCASVHKETLVPIGIGGKKPENHFNEKGHDRIDYPSRQLKSNIVRDEKLTFLSKSTYKHSSLQHWFIFPNLFITSTLGNLFYIGRLNAISYNESELDAQFFNPKYGDLNKKERIVLDAYSQSAINSSKKVINEDLIILEEIQKNLVLIPEKNQIFGEEEFRIKAFHNHIKNFINYK